MNRSNRREFLKTLAGLTSGLLVPYSGLGSGKGSHRDSIGSPLPLRKLGVTGERVTMLGLGGYHIGWTSEQKAADTIEVALEEGIRFFDTAEGYAGGGSEKRYGKYLIPKYRDEIFLMTKTQAKDAKTTREHLEGSLKRMKTDVIDLWQVHSLFTPDDVDRRIENGVLEVIDEAKKSGKVRYVGFTGHQSPYAHARMLDKTGTDFFDACLFPVNVMDAGVTHSFIQQVMPRLIDRKMGLLAMKTLADGRFFPKKVQNGRVIWDTDKPVVPNVISIEEALAFAWSLPISVLITGAENPELLREKAVLARQFQKLSQQEKDALIHKVAELPNKGKVEYYKKVKTG
jgi:aryl-alcohol dehydrogenase-like predicted oxidoreductase